MGERDWEKTVAFNRSGKEFDVNEATRSAQEQEGEQTVVGGIADTTEPRGVTVDLKASSPKEDPNEALERARARAMLAGSPASSFEQTQLVSAEELAEERFMSSPPGTYESGQPQESVHDLRRQYHDARAELQQLEAVSGIRSLFGKKDREARKAQLRDIMADAAKKLAPHRENPALMDDEMFAQFEEDERTRAASS